MQGLCCRKHLAQAADASTWVQHMGPLDSVAHCAGGRVMQEKHQPAVHTPADSSWAPAQACSRPGSSAPGHVQVC